MNNIIKKLDGKNIAILGFGREGYSTYKYVRKYLNNQKLTIIDQNVNLKEIYLELKNDINVNFVLGNNYLDSLEEYDYIIKTPGISLDNSDLEERLTSQMDLVLSETDAYIIGVTGTKGKSTTTSLIYEVIKEQDKSCYLVGNIGNPILDYIDLVEKDTILVTEFSAHQLQYLKKSPKIGIILNLFEEHLDYFKTKEKYYNAKLNMFKYQQKEDYALYYKDNITLNEFVNQNEYVSNKISISSSNNKNNIYIGKDYIYNQNGDIIYNNNDDRKLIGDHNLINIAFVLTVANILNLDIKKAINSINGFVSLKHRLQNIGTYNEITFYSDTISTIPASTMNGINSLKLIDTLILGGMDRGINYNEFIDDLNNSDINNFICMPDTGNKIGKALKNKNVYFIDDLEDAVKLAYEITEKNKMCLLSPAAPSYNKFKNYDEKGNAFIKYVKEYSTKEVEK